MRHLKVPRPVHARRADNKQITNTHRLAEDVQIAGKLGGRLAHVGMHHGASGDDAAQVAQLRGLGMGEGSEYRRESGGVKGAVASPPRPPPIAAGSRRMHWRWHRSSSVGGTCQLSQRLKWQAEALNHGLGTGFGHQLLLGLLVTAREQGAGMEHEITAVVAVAALWWGTPVRGAHVHALHGVKAWQHGSMAAWQHGSSMAACQVPSAAVHGETHNTSRPTHPRSGHLGGCRDRVGSSQGHGVCRRRNGGGRRGGGLAGLGRQQCLAFLHGGRSAHNEAHRGAALDAAGAEEQ